MMKKLYLIGITFIYSVSIMAQEEVKQEIGDLLDSWHAAAANNDLEGYFDIIDDDGIYIGTDSSEIWTRAEFYNWSTPYFEDEKGWDFTSVSRNIYLAPDESIAWFDELLHYGKGTLRGSGVLISREGQWRILHYVLSIPVPNDKYRDVMRVIHAPPALIENQE